MPVKSSEFNSKLASFELKLIKRVRMIIFVRNLLFIIFYIYFFLIKKILNIEVFWYINFWDSGSWMR